MRYWVLENPNGGNVVLQKHHTGQLTKVSENSHRTVTLPWNPVKESTEIEFFQMDTDKYSNFGKFVADALKLGYIK